MIISRYLTKEIANTLLAVTCILLLIFLSNRLVRFLSYADSGKIAANILFQLIGFEIPYLLSLLLPLGLFLGIILSYGRLYADNELRVLHACGLSLERLLQITSGIGIVITIIVAILMLWINPWLANEKSKLIARSMSAENIFDTVMPGRFQVTSDGRRVIYVEKISHHRKRADNLFIAQQVKNAIPETNSAWTVISAESGEQMVDSDNLDRFIVALNGNRYEGIPGQNDYKVITFKKYAVVIPRTMVALTHHEQEAVPTSTLLKNYADLGNAAELQWRLSIPLSVILLIFLAIPLSYVKPRQGKYSQLLPAILVYIIYVNLLFMARNWIEQKILPVNIGVWSVHFLLFALASVLMMVQTGFIRRVLRRL